MGNIINFNEKMEENKMVFEDTEKMVEKISTAFWGFYEEEASKIEEFLQKNKIDINIMSMGKIIPVWDSEWEYNLYKVILKNDTIEGIVSFDYYDEESLNIADEGDRKILICNIFEKLPNENVWKYEDFLKKYKIENKDYGEHFYDLYKELYVKLTLAFGKSFMNFVKEIQED